MGCSVALPASEEGGLKRSYSRARRGNGRVALPASEEGGLKLVTVTVPLATPLSRIARLRRGRIEASQRCHHSGQLAGRIARLRRGRIEAWHIGIRMALPCQSH